MPAVIAWFAQLVPTIFSWVIGDSVLKFFAQKVLLVGLATIVLPIILNNFAYDLMNVAFSLIGDTNVTGINGSLSFTGLAAYLVIQLRLPDCLSVISSALLVRASLNMIPFVRV